jgi:hypothetical protein
VIVLGVDVPGVLASRSFMFPESPPFLFIGLAPFRGIRISSVSA